MQKTNIAKYVFIALTVLVVCFLILTLIVRFYKDSDGATLLDYAIENNSLIQVRCLVALGADVKAKGYAGLTTIQNAAFNGSLEIVQWLVEQGADINAKDKYGRTVLHLAACSDYVEQQRLRGFNYVLQLAVYSDSVKVIQWLVEQGLDINAKDNDGETPLDMVCGLNNDVIQWIKEHGGKESKR